MPLEVKPVLQGNIGTFAATYNGGTDEITLTTSIGGVTYTSNAIAADTSINSGANEGISSGTVITFTADAGGVNETSFDITLGADVIIDADSGNTNTFVNNLATALDSQSIYQAREITNFTDASVKSPLTGLTSANVKFISNNATQNIGSINGFTVERSTGSDGSISVVIGEETFRATGLGTTLNSNITLQSTTSEKQLQLNFADAGISVNISNTTNANSLERALDYSFGTRTLTDLEVSSGDSLNDIVFAINQKSSVTGLSASVIQVSDFDYRLSFKADNEGISNAYDLFDSSSVLTNASIVTETSAQDAVFSIDGLEISRSTNNITDAVENVTINIVAPTPGYGTVDAESIQVKVDNDTDIVVTQIEELLTAYNEVKIYHATQNQRDTKTLGFLEDSILGGDTLLEGISSQILDILNTIVDSGNSNFDSLSDIGITFSDFAGDATTVATSNILIYDDAKLKNAISNNFDRVRTIFELDVQTSSAKLAIFKSSNAFTINDFKLEIDDSQPSGQQVKLLNTDGSDYLVSGQNVYLDYADGKITGRAGSVVSGLEFIYIGEGDETISVNITQGIADKIYNFAENYTKKDGVLATEINSLTENNSDYKDEVRSQESRLKDYKTSLNVKFSNLEAAIQKVNNILLFLDANTAAANTNNN